MASIQTCATVKAACLSPTMFHGRGSSSGELSNTFGSDVCMVILRLTVDSSLVGLCIGRTLRFYDPSWGLGGDVEAPQVNGRDWVSWADKHTGRRRAVDWNS